MAADYTVAPDLQHLGYTGGIFLGRGGEGCVYRFKYCGRQDRGCVRPGQLVAIKITPGPKIRPNEVLVQSRIDHSGIVKVLDVARCAHRHLVQCHLDFAVLDQMQRSKWPSRPGTPQPLRATTAASHMHRNDSNALERFVFGDRWLWRALPLRGRECALCTAQPPKTPARGNLRVCFLATSAGCLAEMRGRGTQAALHHHSQSAAHSSTHQRHLSDTASCLHSRQHNRHCHQNCPRPRATLCSRSLAHAHVLIPCSATRSQSVATGAMSGARPIATC